MTSRSVLSSVSRTMWVGSAVLLAVLRVLLGVRDVGGGLREEVCCDERVERLEEKRECS